MRLDTPADPPLTAGPTKVTDQVTDGDDPEADTETNPANPNVLIACSRSKAEDDEVNVAVVSCPSNPMTKLLVADELVIVCTSFLVGCSVIA